MPWPRSPDRGDVVWISLNPQAGHEQAGRRPALVVPPASYNGKVGLAVLCPITNQVKGYPFEALIPSRANASSCRSRRARVLCGESHRRLPTHCHLPGQDQNGPQARGSPVEQPRTFEVVIDPKAARVLGLIIPPLLQSCADHVIE